MAKNRILQRQRLLYYCLVQVLFITYIVCLRNAEYPYIHTYCTVYNQIISIPPKNTTRKSSAIYSTIYSCIFTLIFKIEKHFFSYIFPHKVYIFYSFSLLFPAQLYPSTPIVPEIFKPDHGTLGLIHSKDKKLINIWSCLCISCL